ncbi:MAG: nucleotide exchange factor GrpE [Betaproteobacteria bacterium]|nr:nucleotide exchange factor GrpE [Betaproteobacteria bacterium]MDH3437134.1 nucleotide exchange factor GrpE [Betaproteobacteria bacterium]
MQETPDARTADLNQQEGLAGELTEQPGAPETPQQAPESPAAETMPSPEVLLKRAELAAQEHHDAWLRARAEADNIRKRAQVDIASAHKFAAESFATEMLAVKDSLEAALVVENASVESMKSGVELTLKQLRSVFEKFSLVEIDPAGQKFDPHRHQAISVVECEAEPNTVVQVLQKGYLLHDRVVRPALVTVAKAKSVES